ncbi:hypothetical protein [Nitrosospira sp. Nsp2]|uniref:hypothetical protein n=1 Tax=Nitrosospira sp. Nsp2 TaxID=136548 RepID=UPI0021591BE6|nr:hypothetical protein [Nitrosospira sp. Nsp2]
MPAIESAALITRFGKTKPDLAVQSTHQVVRVAGQVVEEDSGLGAAMSRCEPTQGSSTLGIYRSR